MFDNCVICNEPKDTDNLRTCEMCEEQELATFDEGVRYALNYLSDLYDGIKETDLWKEYFIEEETN